MIRHTLQSLRDRARLLSRPWRSNPEQPSGEVARAEELLLTDPPPSDDAHALRVSDDPMPPLDIEQAREVQAPATPDLVVEQPALEQIADEPLVDDGPAFLPERIVAASLPYVSGDPEEMAWHDACYVCGTEQIRLTVTLHDGRVWYIAAPANEFAGYGSAINILADALPGMPGHQGIGCYQAETLKATVSIFRLQDSLKTIIGDPQMADLYRAENGNPPLFKAAGHAPWIMRDIRNAQLDRIFINRVNAFSWSVAIVAATLAAISIGVSDGLATRIAETERQRRQITTGILGIMQDLQRQPLRDQMADIRNMYAKTTQYRGTLHVIRIDKGQPIAAKIDVPPWVPDAEVSRLAAGGTVTASEQYKTIVRGKL